ncbi:MAG: SMC-Scp complex subunit ScpB [Desulfobacteraceae bacterium]|nr:MAG: SMC-Scp complex subunit ScpB [Desulfobacteraceae bacterium]
MEELKNIIESLIFVSKEPLSIHEVKKILPDIDAGEIRSALDALFREYEENKRGFYLREVAGGYQFRSRPEYRQWIAELIKPNPVRLSKAALETLAIIAYRQPIIRSDIEHIRGVDSGGILRMLMEKKLIRALGRKDIPGRPLIYATTKQFLAVFDLKDLKDLPSLKEIEEFGKQSAAMLDEIQDMDDRPEDEPEQNDPIESPARSLDVPENEDFSGNDEP